MNWLADISVGTNIDYRHFEHRARLEHSGWRSSPRTVSGLGRIAAGFGSLGTRYRAWSAKRAAISELQGLDDRMLNDIGLHRGDIVAAARADFERKGRDSVQYRHRDRDTQKKVADVRDLQSEPVWREAA